MRLLQEHPQRMVRERLLLQQYARETDAFTLQSWSTTPAGELCVRFRLQLLHGAFDGVLVYPELFPDVPAFIRPQRAGESWSLHQYGGSGVLCLQYGPDNWHPDITGADLVKSASALLWGEFLHGAVPAAFEPVPSRHEVTPIQVLGEHSHRLLLTPALRKLFAEAGQPNPLPIKVVVDWLRRESVAVVTDAGSPSKPVADVSSALAQGPGILIHGVAVAVASAAALESSQDASDARQRMGADWPWQDGLDDKYHLLLAHDAAGKVCAFLLRGGDKPWFRRYYPLGFGDETRQRLPSAFTKLSGASVAIVGLGSLGSKIAVSLARAGVRKFLLVDDDVLGPHNLVRNQFSWMDVGFSKVEAGSRALRLIAPGVEVQTRAMHLAGQSNPSLASELASDLMECTLVVDATANPRAFLALAALTKRAKVPIVWGEVFAGGGGCLMARSRPGLDADALATRAHMHGVMQGMAPVPKAKAEAYGLVNEGAVYVASDADVSALAASMAQLCLDTLCADVTEYPVAAYLIGFRKFWEFRCPFDVIPIDCAGASQPEPEQCLSADEVAELDAIRRAIEDPDASNHGSS